MAVKNLNLALNTLAAAKAGNPGRDAVAGVLGQTMSPALSHGRPMSPGLMAFQPTRAEARDVVTTYRLFAKRVGRSAASLPGIPVRSRFWREPAAGVTASRRGTACPSAVNGRGLSDWCERHHEPSGHDYPSHDRRDDQRHARTGHQRPAGSAPITNRGK
jgi:hypothetical protein